MFLATSFGPIELFIHSSYAPSRSVIDTFSCSTLPNWRCLIWSRQKLCLQRLLQFRAANYDRHSKRPMYSICMPSCTCSINLSKITNYVHVASMLAMPSAEKCGKSAVIHYISIYAYLCQKSWLSFVTSKTCSFNNFFVSSLVVLVSHVSWGLPYRSEYFLHA
jgi:hypothetical protein